MKVLHALVLVLILTAGSCSWDRTLLGSAPAVTEESGEDDKTHILVIASGNNGAAAGIRNDVQALKSSSSLSSENSNVLITLLEDFAGEGACLYRFDQSPGWTQIAFPELGLREDMPVTYDTSSGTGLSLLCEKFLVSDQRNFLFIDSPLSATPAAVFLGPDNDNGSSGLSFVDLYEALERFGFSGNTALFLNAPFTANTAFWDLLVSECSSVAGFRGGGTFSSSQFAAAVTGAAVKRQGLPDFTYLEDDADSGVMKCNADQTQWSLFISSLSAAAAALSSAIQTPEKREAVLYNLFNHTDCTWEVPGRMFTTAGAVYGELVSAGFTREAGDLEESASGAAGSSWRMLPVYLCSLENDGFPSKEFPAELCGGDAGSALPVTAGCLWYPQSAGEPGFLTRLWGSNP